MNVTVIFGIFHKYLENFIHQFFSLNCFVDSVMEMISILSDEFTSVSSANLDKKFIDLVKGCMLFKNSSVTLIILL